MKAVLVLDEMPERCEECPLCRRDTFEQLGCSAQSHVINVILRMVGQKKPRWCPLRPMPDYDYRDMYEPADYCYQVGWNKCIKAIEGSGEDA
ncbi:MAG: hypothetical protein LIP12_00115 [Clostridiales bacterium]|nr:hypothetical protein [Clostridiales bacterium]